MKIVKMGLVILDENGGLTLEGFNVDMQGQPVDSNSITMFCISEYCKELTHRLNQIEAHERMRLEQLRKAHAPTSSDTIH